MLKNISRCNSIIRHSVAASTVNLTTTATAVAPLTTTNPTTQLIRKFRLLAQQHINCRKMSSSASGVSTTTTEGKTHKHTNRLAEEKSPYLLQHAHNPVDWYPWGPEAIERARTENKLIFLSVGYSTCHWCHVMEHESFESETVAALMNKHFINIKVDREERPDIDKIYMQFVLMMNGSGGWPMSVWLTPDLAPITAGTYFPPKDRWGMPSFTTVLKTVASKWAENQEQFKSTGLKVIEALQKSLSEKSNEATYEPGSAEEKLKQTVSIFKQRYDQHHGGFGAHPKFPEVSRLNFLFHAYIVTKDTDVLDMVVQTLHHMGRGGIHDHVFGGFARYSVDRQWHVPHFEKMLYDQGQLLGCYASAYKLTRDESFLRYADGIFRYLQQDLRHPDGGYYAGEDADSYPTGDDTIKVEGAFYAWTSTEIKSAITTNEEKYAKLNMTIDRIFEIYTHHYDVLEAGNVKPFSDPHGHLTAKNILIVRGSEQKTCEKFDITTEQLQDLINITNAAMHEIRNQRPRPHLDTKIICAWNGLVLSGLAKLANCDSPKRAEYLKAGAKLVEFMRKNLYDGERQVLLRSCYGSGVNEATLKTGSNETIDGFLDDYAFLIRGLLDYYKSSLDGEALQWAKQLQETQDKLFWDSTNGAYYYSQENAANVIVRLKDDHDGAEPSGNSVAARNLTLLSHYFDEESYQKRATELLTYFGDVQPFGYTLPEMMSALLLIENGLDLVAVVGPDSETTQQFVHICRKFYIPGMIIVHIDPQHPDAACNRRVQEKFKMIKDQPTVYICHDRVCRMPVTDPATLEENLQERFFNGTNV